MGHRKWGLLLDVARAYRLGSRGGCQSDTQFAGFCRLGPPCCVLEIQGALGDLPSIAVYLVLWPGFMYA